MFLRNVGWNSTDYMASYPRRWYSSWPPLWKRQILCRLLVWIRDEASLLLYRESTVIFLYLMWTYWDVYGTSLERPCCSAVGLHPSVQQNPLLMESQHSEIYPQ
jgi:hypothetical protein